MARRSARLSKANPPPQSAQSAAAAEQPANVLPVLSSVLESDEFQDAPEHQLASNNNNNDNNNNNNNNNNTPPSRRSSEAPSGRKKRTATTTTTTTTTSLIATPKTEPKPSRGEMHPKTVHPTTAEPDSGFKLGFVDIDKSRRQSMGVQNTPSKTTTERSTTGSAFQFTFNSEAQLSEDARKLMAQVRADAAKIKTELVAEREAQDRKDQDAEQMFDGPSGGVGGGGRKIAQPRSKAGRFSDVHMAQFRKMDSIANHPSAFRARPGYIRPTAQSLKRSGSKAELDAPPERPRTAGKGTPGHLAPPQPGFVGRSASASPFKSVPPTSSSSSRTTENMNQAKRVRRSEFEDVSATRPATADDTASSPPATTTTSGLPKSRSTVLFPTKASLARTGGGGSSSAATQAKPSMLPRSNSSARSVKPTPSLNRPRFSSASVSRFTSKLLEARKQAQECATAQSAARSKPLPPLPTEVPTTPTKTAATTTVRKPAASASRLPTLAGLKSILRSPQKTAATGLSTQPRVPVPESAKKVDFTPSVKSRYAVKLAAASPSPAKMPRDQDAAGSKRGPVVPYDPAAYAIEADSDETWEEEASSPIDYPVLPPIDLSDQADSFIHKARGHAGRGSGEFKSIFTTLHPSNPAPVAAKLTAASPAHATANGKQVLRSPSRSTIRRVRPSEVAAGAAALIQPFEDRSVAIMAHGLPAKKRRRASDSVEPVEKRMRDSSSHGQKLPGSWTEHVAVVDEEDENDADDEGCRRGGKRARMTLLPDEATKENNAPVETASNKSPVKKSAAREQAAKHARDRKTRGKSLAGLTTSRLNALAQPKSRG